MNKIFLAILLVISFLAFPQENTEQQQSEEKKEEKVKLKSIDEERKETLLYGIDQEVKELLGILKKDEVSGFTPELVKLLESAFDEEIKIGILDYFIVMDIDAGEKEAIKIYDAIEYEDDYTDTYAQKSLEYLSKIGSKEAIERVPDILLSENEVVLKSALKLIGENEVTQLEDKLLEMLEDDETDDQVYLEVIRTLGGIKSIKALDTLIPIADDEDEETTVRNAVCYSLGEIGDDKAIPVLKRCLSDRKNYLLRRSALAALGKFESADMNSILIESLRDPHWRIRYEACKSLGKRKVKEAFPILKYKALKDPESKIKNEALKAIGDINTNECKDFLKEIFIEDSYPDSAKVVAIEKLIEHNVSWIFPEIEKLYEKDHKKNRKAVLDASIKYLTKKEFSGASSLYGRMLDHESYLYKIYAIKGLRLNNISSYNSKLKELSEKDKNKGVKKHALSALDEL